MSAEGVARADRIINEEMLIVGDVLRKARTYEEWERAHLQLEELGRAAAAIHSTTPYMESQRMHDELNAKPVNQGRLF